MRKLVLLCLALAAACLPLMNPPTAEAAATCEAICCSGFPGTTGDTPCRFNGAPSPCGAYWAQWVCP